MVLLRPPFSSKHCFSLRWLRQCSRTLSPENKFSGPPLRSRGLRCSKFSLQRNFQGLLSIVQLSRFLSFFSSDSLYRLTQRHAFVKNFFHPLPTSFSPARHSSNAFCLPPVVPPPRLRSAGSQKFSSVISDRCYLITLEGNCQRFSCFLFISDNSHIFTVSTAKNCDQHCPIIVHSVFPKTIPPFCIFFFFHTTL